jgi:hypothetical protein
MLGVNSPKQLQGCFGDHLRIRSNKQKDNNEKFLEKIEATDSR